MRRQPTPSSTKNPPPQGLTAEEVEGAILCSTQSTAQRYAALHQAHVNLHAVCAAQAAQLEAQRQAELKVRGRLMMHREGCALLRCLEDLCGVQQIYLE